MADKKPTHRVVIGDKYTTSNGEQKTAWTEVGSGWTTSGGGVSVKLRPGLALTGDFMLFLNTERNDAGDAGE